MARTGPPGSYLGETTVVLCLRLLCSGIVFSTAIAARERISGILAMNLLGAIAGGLVECNSMYLGFQALYLIAMVCYLLAFASELAFRDKTVKPIVSLG